MKLIKTSNKHQVYSTWLKSELFDKKTNLTRNQIGLIENPNLEDQEENEKREELLFTKFDRKPILDNIPGEILWHRVEIEKKDIDNIYVLSYWDWFMDTGKTFKLSEIKRNLTVEHGKHLPEFPLGKLHKIKLARMEANIDKDLKDIIMISSSQKGPYTIIDGTHRSSLLALRDQLVGTKAYLGLIKDLTNCAWSPESKIYSQNVSELNYLAQNGYIW